MAKRSFAALIAVLLLPATQSYAQPIAVTVDGCTRLARVVYTEVSAAAVYGPGKSGPWMINLGKGDISVCAHTAKTVSQAFSSAMLSAGIDVSWSRGPMGTGDFCLSHYLSQCYPDRERTSFSTFGTQAAFVQKSWSIVSQAVMREMYNPFSSDEVRFRDEDLSLRLGLALRSMDVADRY